MTAKDAAWGAVHSFVSTSPSSDGEAATAALLDDMNARLDALLLVNDALEAALEAREEAEQRAGRGCREDGALECCPLASALGLHAAKLAPLRRLDTALPPLAVLGHSPGISLSTQRSAPEEPRQMRRALPPPPLPRQTDSWEAATHHGRQRAGARADEVGPLPRNSFGRVSTPAAPQGARRRVAVSASGVLLPFGPPRRSGKARESTA